MSSEFFCCPPLRKDCIIHSQSWYFFYFRSCAYSFTSKQLIKFQGFTLKNEMFLNISWKGCERKCNYPSISFEGMGENHKKSLLGREPNPGPPKHEAEVTAILYFDFTECANINK
jgi:hypothetical protein